MKFEGVSVSFIKKRVPKGHMTRLFEHNTAARLDEEGLVDFGPRLWMVPGALHGLLLGDDQGQGALAKSGPSHALKHDNICVTSTLDSNNISIPTLPHFLFATCP